MPVDWNVLLNAYLHINVHSQLTYLKHCESDYYTDSFIWSLSLNHE